VSGWLINVGGLVLAGLIVWWFWLSKPRARMAQSGPVDVLVADGVYQPARIEVPAGQPVTLRFLRRDPSPCAEKVIFDGLDLAADLPLNATTDVILPSPPPGEYEFTCDMRMYRGSLVVR
jgi:plastocyanin domain-containing protein